MKVTNCDKCNTDIKNCNYKKHYKSCNGQGTKQKLLGCPHCRKTWLELNVVRSEKGNHTRWCVENPRFQEYKEDLKKRDTVSLMKQGKIKKYGQVSWNKGLTKETSKSVKRGAEKLKEKYKSGELVKLTKGKTLTKEHKEKVSLGMKKAHKEGRHSGYSFINKDPSRMSYPEKFLKKMFEEANLFKKFNIEIHKSVGKYFLDFSFTDLKIDFEVDSQYHIKDNIALNHDKERNEFLIKEGWCVYRIFWKDFLKQPEVEFNKFLGYLKNKERPKLITYNVR